MDYHHKLDPISYPKVADIKKYLMGKIVRSEVYTLKVSNNTVGFALYYVENGHLHVTDLVVDKKCRKKGYGKNIMSAIEKIAKKRNCKSICLTVSYFNIVAHQMYKNNGFRESSITMFKRIK